VTYQLYVVELATGEPINAWLKSADVNAYAGRGHCEFTMRRDEALAFPDFVAAMDFWKLQSTVTPIRPDGKPNRPLTAYTVQPCREDRQPFLVPLR
jgi:hypothetical protein